MTRPNYRGLTAREWAGSIFMVLVLLIPWWCGAVWIVSWLFWPTT